MDDAMRALWWGLVLLCSWSHVGAQTAPGLRPEIAVLFSAAQDALKAKQAELALDKLNTASALPPLPGKETEFLQRLRVAAGLDAGKPAIAMAALEALVSLPEVPASEKPGLIESVISLAQKQKDHQRVIEAAKLFGNIPAAPTRGTLLALAQAHYFLKRYDLTIAQINALLPTPAAAPVTAANPQNPPEEYLLRMLADSHQQLKNRTGYLQSLALLLQYHPSQAYWSDYLSRHISQLEASSPLALDWYRLVRAAQCLQEADDFLEYVQHALKAGFPLEAQAMLEQGDKSGLLASASAKQAVDTLGPQIARRVSEDATAVERLEKQLPSAANGNTAAQLADLHLASGKWEQAQALYRSALEKGGLRREELTRLRLGIALAKNGQKDAAQAVLVWDGWSPSARALAQAWSLWAHKVLK
jgi:tetratricopeptide (TPR) repeat protein